jgi:hypothetical protein
MYRSSGRSGCAFLVARFACPTVDSFLLVKVPKRLKAHASSNKLFQPHSAEDRATGTEPKGMHSPNGSTSPTLKRKTVSAKIDHVPPGCCTHRYVRHRFCIHLPGAHQVRDDNESSFRWPSAVQAPELCRKFQQWPLGIECRKSSRDPLARVPFYEPASKGGMPRPVRANLA